MKNNCSEGIKIKTIFFSEMRTDIFSLKFKWPSLLG